MYKRLAVITLVSVLALASATFFLSTGYLKKMPKETVKL